MTTPEGLGRKAHQQGRSEHIKEVHVKSIEADIKRVKDQGELKMSNLLVEEKRINEELASRGNLSQEVARESFIRGLLMLLLLAVCIPGEFVFARWTVEYFSLSPLETYIIAGTIIVIILKGFDLYLEFLRKQYPNLEGRIFLALGCTGVVAIFVLIFFSAELRQELQKTLSFIGFTESLEAKVQTAEQFEKHNLANLIWLMVTLTAAFAIIGGVSFHIAKNRILSSLPLLKLHRQRRNIRRELLWLAEEIAAQDSRVPQFIAQFETGMMKAESQLNELTSMKDPVQSSGHRPRRKGIIGPIFAFPISLLLFALIFFLLLRGMARGSEAYIILLDMSTSVSVKDYAGKESEFEKNVKAIEHFMRNNISPGDELKVFAITERSFERPYALLDESISKDKGSFGERLARKRLQLFAKWEQLAPKAATAKGTDIFGAINLSAIFFPSTSGKKNLLFYSDMRQCTHDFDLERPSRINVEAILNKVEQQGLIPLLEGVNVRCLGVHSARKTPGYWLDLKKFWTLYFERAKAKLLTFSMERSVR